MLVDGVRFPREGNPHFPLPPDYFELSEAGKRQARINAVCLSETPEDHVHAWAFFKRYYLESLPSGMWYKPPYYPSPPMHYGYTNDIHCYARNVIVFPRSFAKSTLLAENVLRWLVAWPFHETLVIKSGENQCKSLTQKLKFQLENNGKIRDDFGILKPRKGAGSWSGSVLGLSNGSKVSVLPIMSRSLLGHRPDIWIADDVEFDPAMQIVKNYLTEQLKYLLFQHLEPMLDQGKTGVLQGTLLSRKSMLYQVAASDEAEEPRWGYWQRTIWPAKLPDGTLTWPEKFSEARLQERRDALGHAAYAAQFLNDPGSDEDCILRIHPFMGTYTVEDEDERLETQPLASDATLVSWIHTSRTDEDTGEKEVERVERPFGQTINKMVRVALVDPAKVETSDADYSAIVVVGAEHNPKLYRNTYWVLDAWQDKVNENALIDQIWEMALKWRVAVVGIEALSGQVHFKQKAEAEFIHRAEREGWMPRVKGEIYKGSLKKSKAERIMGLAWRFDSGRIKFPSHLAATDPWAELLYQVSRFTTDLKLLQHDDLLDALAMAPFVLKRGAGGSQADPTPDSTVDFVELLEKGHRTIPGTGLRLIDGLNAKEIPAEALGKIWEARERDRRRRPRYRSRTRRSTGSCGQSPLSHSRLP